MVAVLLPSRAVVVGLEQAYLQLATHRATKRQRKTSLWFLASVVPVAEYRQLLPPFPCDRATQSSTRCELPEIDLAHVFLMHLHVEKSDHTQGLMSIQLE